MPVEPIYFASRETSEIRLSSGSPPGHFCRQPLDLENFSTRATARGMRTSTRIGGEHAPPIGNDHPIVGPLRCADERATIARRAGIQEGAMCRWWRAIFLTLATSAVAEPIEHGDV
jgi:hypothetical protein